MQPNNETYTNDYDFGTATESRISEESQTRLPHKVGVASDTIDFEKEKYALGKPRRIIIRARITHD